VAASHRRRGPRGARDRPPLGAARPWRLRLRTRVRRLARRRKRTDPTRLRGGLTRLER
jgi:hypothetical protein